MSLYHLHEGVLNVPEGWADQSMNVFRLPGKNSNKDAAIIVTRDYETPLQSPSEYADAQQEAAKKSFPGYKQLDRTDILIGGQEATCVDYQWRSNGSALLRQRQVYVRRGRAMLTLTLSAMANEFARLEDPWQEMLASFTFIERECEPVVQAAVPKAEILPHVFALSAKDRGLRVLASVEEAVHRIDVLDVEAGAWVFFSSTGAPLKPIITQANRRGVFRSERGTYELVPDTAGVSPPLQQRLQRVSGVSGLAPFDTLERIAEHLMRNAATQDDITT